LRPLSSEYNDGKVLNQEVRQTFRAESQQVSILLAFVAFWRASYPCPCCSPLMGKEQYDRTFECLVHPFINSHRAVPGILLSPLMPRKAASSAWVDNLLKFRPKRERELELETQSLIIFPPLKSAQ